MSNSEERIKSIWEEIIVKERLKTIMTKLEKDQLNTREIIKEELTNLWNISEVPTFKQILEKLQIIHSYLEQNQAEGSTTQIKEEPELVAINAIGRLKEPMIVDISKSKPKINKEVKTVLNNLAELHKKGNF